MSSGKFNSFITYSCYTLRKFFIAQTFFQSSFFNFEFWNLENKKLKIVNY